VTGGRLCDFGKAISEAIMRSLAVGAPIDSIVATELDIRRTFRFDAKPEPAASLMNRGRIDARSALAATAQGAADKATKCRNSKV
jgi:hypothetical protein